MRLSKRQVEDILDLVWDWSDYEVEGNYLYGYDVVPSLNEKMKEELGVEIAKIVISPKKKWWKFWQNGQ